jgi:hypothetical protein
MEWRHEREFRISRHNTNRGESSHNKGQSHKYQIPQQPLPRQTQTNATQSKKHPISSQKHTAPKPPNHLAVGSRGSSRSSDLSSSSSCNSHENRISSRRSSSSSSSSCAPPGSTGALNAHASVAPPAPSIAPHLDRSQCSFVCRAHPLLRQLSVFGLDSLSGRTGCSFVKNTWKLVQEQKISAREPKIHMTSR